MSAKGHEDPGDLVSRVGAESSCSDMKRVAAKKLIERYFYQLTDGCGNLHCDNQYCASSGKVTNLTPNQAAAQAIQLFSQEARLCDRTYPSKVARTSRELAPESLVKPRLPVKSMNSTCSIEGTAAKLDIIGSSTKHENLPFVVVEVSSKSWMDNSICEGPKLSSKILSFSDNAKKRSKPTSKSIVPPIPSKPTRLKSKTMKFYSEINHKSSLYVTNHDGIPRSGDSIYLVEKSSSARISILDDVYVQNCKNNYDQKLVR